MALPVHGMEEAMTIYLAGRYGRQNELLGYAEELHALGHIVTSRWLLAAHEMRDENPNHDEARRFAIEDIDDMDNARLGERRGRHESGHRMLLERTDRSTNHRQMR